jgi:hypothetical protein
MGTYAQPGIDAEDDHNGEQQIQGEPPGESHRSALA